MLIEELAPGVVVIGTAHVSPTSVAEVEATIRARRPAKVLVELDARRLGALQDPEAWRRTDIVQVLREGKQHLFLLQLYLTAMQARMGRETGVAPGAELLKAVEVAKEVGAEVVLIDRDVGTTLKRSFAGLGLQQKLGLAMNVLLEMLPTAEPDPKAKRPSPVLQVLPPFLLIAAMAAFLPFGRRVASGADRILDLLVGYPSVPALTMVVLGLGLGAILAVAWPLQDRPKHPWAERVEGLAWLGLVAGLAGWWAWGFVDGFSPAFLGRMLPGPTPPGLGAAAAGAWTAVGLVLSFRLTRMVGRVLAQRRAFAAKAPLDVEALLQKDAITQMTDEFARFAPAIKHALIDERDTYMASHIAEQAAAAPRHPSSAAGTAGWQSGEVPPAGSGGVVAVVGAGHLAGIKAQVGTARAQDRLALDELPKARMTAGKVLGWAIPLALVGVFVYLAWRGVQEGNLHDLWASLGWFALITATCSAAGAALALAHPYSIGAAFLAAPIATLHPLIASGWFAGLVEAKVRTPKVADFEAIKTLDTFGQFWRNGVVRILLVTALTNVGAMVGFWIATGRVLQILGGGA